MISRDGTFQIVFCDPAMMGMMTKLVDSDKKCSVCSGYVEFWSTEACEKAATLNGKNLLGRPIRIDWTD